MVFTSDSFFKGLSAYISSMATSLTELDVTDVVLEVSHFKNVVRLFRSHTSVLTALHLAIDELDPQVFAFMSHALPHLQRLTLRYGTFKLSEEQEQMVERSAGTPRNRVATEQLSCSNTSLTEAQAIGILDSTIIAFLNHNNHIKHLVLGVFGGGAFDSSILLNCVGPFPSLTTLSFSHALSPEGAGIASAIHIFIMTKVPGLQELSLELDRIVQLAGVFSLQETQRYNIQLSKLRLHVASELTRPPYIRAPPFISDDFFKQLSAYIDSIATSLTELDVNGVFLNFTQFKNVVRLFKSPTKVLTALHLPIDELDPQVFVFMSHALPRLQRLTVRYCILDGRPPPTVGTSETWMRRNEVRRNVLPVNVAELFG
ncbi:hypothetical protein H1R20_g470, partial [Candolleomyces eurysporus]